MGDENKMTDITWVIIVLWLASMVLSQVWRTPEGRGGLLAFASVLGFVLALAMFREAQAVVALVLFFLNLWLLYGALETW
jgi:hypothetical protein